MLATWIICAALILLHARAVRDYVGLLNGIGMKNPRSAATPLRQVVPARYADAQMWVRHVLTAEETGVARLRFTPVDNAPEGRPVHWSSGFAWLVRGAGVVQRTLTADGWPLALERALLWFNTPLLLAVMIGLSTWVWRRAGVVTGVIVACAIVGHKRFYEGFSPAYVDHHGLVTTTVLGLLLGIAFMGAGWWRGAATETETFVLLPASRERARRAAVASALFGAVGLWLSAAAMLPAIALTGFAGLVVTWRHGRSGRAGGAVFAPDVWRLWGRVGGVAAIACYILEYAPDALAWRLEVNHPLYALAWWGGAEAVATLGAWRLAGNETVAALGRRLLVPALAVLAVPLAVLIGGRAVFLISDPFVADLRHFVAEGKMFAAVVRHSGWGAVGYDVASLLVFVPGWLLWRRSAVESRVVLGVLLVVAVGFAAMALAEVRWWVAGSAAQIALGVALVSVAVRGQAAARRWLIVSIGIVLLAPAVHRVARDAAENRVGRVAEGDLLQPLYRDIAGALRANQPEGEIVLLASPNASAGIGYFGGFKTLGTLYWENAPGLRAAAEIFAASDDDALRLLRARGVTHLVMIATANFVGEYHTLLHPKAGDDALRRSFGARLLANATLPRWLRPIAYRPPSELAAVGGSVELFKIVPEQTDVEYLFHTGVARMARGATAAAENAFAAALSFLPREERPGFCEMAGAACYDYGADAAAVRLFRQALALRPEAALANTTAWILATTSDPRLRDGRAALALVEPLMAAGSDDPMVLSSYAAACAELGRFADAVRAAERAVVLVTRARDRDAAALLQKRLEAYRAQRPWRQ